MTFTAATRAARTALYRLYDAEGRLLYIGIARNPDARMRTHRSLKRWWPEVARAEIEWHSDRNGAERAEAACIVAENPLYNILVPGPGGKARGSRARKHVPRVALASPNSEWYLGVIKGTVT